MTSAAPTIDLEAEFNQHRRGLTGYCYRMLGSSSEAEDAVQETLIKAWRSFDRFEGRSSVQSWLYRIAHHVCIDMHRSPQRRARPMDLGPSTRQADAVLGQPRAEQTWIQPIRDDKVIDLGGDPADVATARETIRLAFVAALQHLPARQRASLILCDVLRWSASDTAELLETTVASVNSALQRARATLADLAPERVDAVTDSGHAELVAKYVDAFERYDIDALVALMRDDVVLSMPPWDLWLEGTDDLAAWFLGQGAGCRGARLVPIAVNGGIGFGNYRQASPGVWEPWALQVVEFTAGRLTGHHNFLDTTQFAALGLPARLEDSPAV